MPRLSKREKQEWDFFIHPNTKRRTYNELCRKCVNNCKQSYRAKVVECRKYVSKRSKNKTKKAAPNPYKRDEVYTLRKGITHLEKVAYSGKNLQNTHHFNTEKSRKEESL